VDEGEVSHGDFLGIALEDVAAASFVYERALERGRGVKLPF